MKQFLKIALFFTLILAILIPQTDAFAQKRPTFKLGVSIYVGWMPWYYVGLQTDILKQWGDQYGINIEVVPMDYIPSVTAFGAGEVDAVVATNMEILDMPAASGVDSRIIVIGDYSNGNDGVVTRGLTSVDQVVKNEVMLVENSVSHYLFVRYLEINKRKESDARIINTSDANIGPAFIANESQKVVVTWNPILMQVAQVSGMKTVFTSAETPGEILDLLVVRNEIAEKYPEFCKALVGAWYEAMGIMSQRGPIGNEAKLLMAERSGANLAEFNAQLKTTMLYTTPQSAVDFGASAEIKEKMEFVRQFCFSHGLLGENATSVDVVGIEYPDGSVQGDKKNIKMRFDNTFMQLAAQGKLAKK